MGEFPAHLTVRLERKGQLRYGENPHQKAAVYRYPRGSSASIVNARHIHGKELSYNNILDLDSALTIARSFHQCRIVHQAQQPLWISDCYHVGLGCS